MQIKGVSVENTLDLAVFYDILVWVATFYAVMPWEKLFGRKKDFQEQLAEFSDDSFLVDTGISCNDVRVGELSDPPATDDEVAEARRGFREIGEYRDEPD